MPLGALTTTELIGSLIKVFSGGHTASFAGDAADQPRTLSDDPLADSNASQAAPYTAYLVDFLLGTDIPSQAECLLAWSPSVLPGTVEVTVSPFGRIVVSLTVSRSCLR